MREKTYRFAEVNHAHIEPNATLAEYDPERGHLTLHTTTQVPYYVLLKVAQCMEMDEAHVRVVKPFVGGGFGARTECLHFEIIAGSAGAKGGRHRAAAADPGGDFPRPSRPPRYQDHRQAGHDQGRQADRLPPAGDCSAAAPMRATASSPSSTPGRCCTGSTRSRRSSTTAGASTPIRRRAAPSGATARSMPRTAFEALMNEMAAELGLDLLRRPPHQSAADHPLHHGLRPEGA